MLSGELLVGLIKGFSMMFACFLLFAILSGLFSCVTQLDFYCDLWLFSFPSVFGVYFFGALTEQTEVKHCGIFSFFVPLLNYFLQSLWPSLSLRADEEHVVGPEQQLSRHSFAAVTRHNSAVSLDLSAC